MREESSGKRIFNTLENETRAASVDQPIFQQVVYSPPSFSIINFTTVILLSERRVTDVLFGYLEFESVSRINVLRSKHKKVSQEREKEANTSAVPISMDHTKTKDAVDKQKPPPLFVRIPPVLRVLRRKGNAKSRRNFGGQYTWLAQIFERTIRIIYLVAKKRKGLAHGP